MKVKITHSLDLDKVASRANELVQPTKRQLGKAIAHLETINYLLSDGSPTSIDLCSAHFEAVRRELGAIDNVIEEVHSMITGLNEYHQNKNLESEPPTEVPPQVEPHHYRQEEVIDDKPV